MAILNIVWNEAGDIHLDDNYNLLGSTRLTVYLP